MISRVISKTQINKVNYVRNFVISSKSNNVNSGISIKQYIKRSLFGVGAGFIAYDAYNEFEVYGGVTRFLRSLKIAALISIDYTYQMYGLKDGSMEYDQVTNQLNFKSVTNIKYSTNFYFLDT